MASLCHRAWLLVVCSLCGCATTKPSPDALRVDELELEGPKALKEETITDRNPKAWGRKSIHRSATICIGRGYRRTAKV